MTADPRTLRKIVSLRQAIFCSDVTPMTPICSLRENRSIGIGITQTWPRIDPHLQGAYMSESTNGEAPSPSPACSRRKQLAMRIALQESVLTTAMILNQTGITVFGKLHAKINVS